jgi:hypothetical protein
MTYFGDDTTTSASKTLALFHGLIQQNPTKYKILLVGMNESSVDKPGRDYTQKTDIPLAAKLYDSSEF